MIGEPTDLQVAAPALVAIALVGAWSVACLLLGWLREAAGSLVGPLGGSAFGRERPR